MDANDLVRRINDNLHWSHIDVNKSLDGEDQTKDIWAQIVALWPKPDESFVDGLYLLLLDREADSAGMAAHCSAMAAGSPRADVVRSLALSDEARMRDLDVSWLPRLDDPPPRPVRSPLVFLKTAFWDLTAVRPRGVWAHVKNRLRRRAS
jgi:hypothetical protein